MLVAEFTAEGDFEGFVKSGLKRLGQVNSGGALLVRECAGVKTLGASIAERDVGGFRDGVGNGIGAEGRAEIVSSAVLELSLYADAAGKICDVGLNDGEESVWIN